MIGCDNKIDMRGYVRFALDARVQDALVKRVLSKIDDRVAKPPHYRRYNDLVLVFFLFDFGLVGELFRLVDTLHGGQQLADRLDLVESVRRQNASAGVLDRRLELDEHQRIETEIGQLVLDGNIRERTV